MRLFFVLFLLACSSPLSFATSKPNIVFILADDLGYGDLGCYGQTNIHTPRLDQMSAEGIRFTSAYAGSTVCAPSRCALMTGFHTGHGRIRGNSSLSLQTNDTTVAQLLKAAGYRTALIGKWGLGEETTPGAPNKKGFDESFGYLNQTHAHNYYTDHLIKNGKRIALQGNASGVRREYSHDLFTAAALDFIVQNKNKPFFLYLAYTIPHARMEVPTDVPYTTKSWPQAEKNKAAMITRMDRDIGILLDTIKLHGLDNTTIVFFSSDNGPHHEGGIDANFHNSRGPLRGYKRNLTEGGIRVPSMVRWPGKIKPGTSDFPWAFWDFLPTVCDIVGIQPPEGIDGASILPTLLGTAQKPHRFFYWEFHEGGSKQAVRMDSWKALRLAPNEPIQLFDLKRDLGETNDLAEKNPEIVSQIENYLKHARTPSANWPIQRKKKKT